MRLIDINNLNTKQHLSFSVCGSDGRCVVSSRIELTEHIISRLKELGMKYIWINDDKVDDIIYKEPISAECRAKALSIYRKTVDNIQRERDINPNDIKDVAKAIVDDMKASGIPVGILNGMYINDEYLPNHAINTAILSVAIGMNMDYNFGQLCDLAVAGFIHDIARNNEHDDEDILHVQKGYEIMHNYSVFSIISNAVILQHHEKYDGTGIPRNLKGTNITEYARIVKIADAFDTAICKSNNVLEYDKAYEAIVNDEGMIYCPEVVKRFKASVQVYLNGTVVVLNNGKQGIVVKQNKGRPLRPVVRIFFNETSDEYEEEDLYDNIDLKISSVII